MVTATVEGGWRSPEFEVNDMEENDNNPNPAAGNDKPEGDQAGSAPSGRREQAARAREMGERWIGQLQEMIDQAGRQAAPVLRDVAAKAAELAAVAAEHAGPVAHKAADVTEQVGDRLAARSKDLAADLRRAADAGRTQGPQGPDGPDGGAPSDGPGA
jgi:hypothetical protein